MLFDHSNNHLSSNFCGHAFLEGPESGNPEGIEVNSGICWIPAFAGMTIIGFMCS
jgi:hypothetical protein